MFSIQEVVKNAIAKMANDKPLTAFEQKMFDQTKAEQKRREAINKKFHAQRQLIGQIDTGKVKNKKPVVVPVYKFVGWDYGKKPQYTSAGLRELRRKQAKKAVKLGLPDGVKEDRIVELWKPSKVEDKMTRQQRRYLERVAKKQEKTNGK